MRLIDADELNHRMYQNAFMSDSNMQKWDGVCWIRYRLFEKTLDKIPTVDAEPVRHGRWITVSDGYGNGVATASICECSLCKDTIWVYKDGRREWHYCPNCGAKMDEGEKND